MRQVLHSISPGASKVRSSVCQLRVDGDALSKFGSDRTTQLSSQRAFERKENAAPDPFERQYDFEVSVWPLGICAELGPTFGSISDRS